MSLLSYHHHTTFLGGVNLVFRDRTGRRFALASAGSVPTCKGEKGQAFCVSCFPFSLENQGGRFFRIVGTRCISALGRSGERIVGMRSPRIKDPCGGYYHILSRIVDRQRVLDQDEKERFRSLLRATESFSGCQTLAYTALDNHILLCTLRRLRLRVVAIPGAG